MEIEITGWSNDIDVLYIQGEFPQCQVINTIFEFNIKLNDGNIIECKASLPYELNEKTIKQYILKNI